MDRNFTDLPDSVDVVLFGTDVTQSILAAACARNGLTVLHLDRNDYYADKSCVFNLTAVEDLVNAAATGQCNSATSESDFQLPALTEFEELLYLPTFDGETFQVVKNDYPCCLPIVSDTLQTTSGVHGNRNVEGGEEISNDLSANDESIDQADANVTAITQQWSKESLLALSRRFNIDMSPNLVYSTGKTVELLVSSDVARYVEFKNIGKIFVFNGKEFENVPCSRADVFADTRLSLIEKRLIMRLFATALDYETKKLEENIDGNGLFLDYLRQNCRLPDRLVFYVQHAIAMVSDQCTTSEGFSRLRNFLKSCSIYGPTPFLWPLYGTAEFPQAFCRLAAVYGAVYVLRSAPVAIIRTKDSGECSGVVLENGKKVLCRFVVSSSSYYPPSLVTTLTRADSSSLAYDLDLRAVILSSKSIFPAEASQQFPPIIFARIPQESFTASIFELPDHTMSCPSKTFLHQVSAPLKTMGEQIVSINDHKLKSDAFLSLLDSLFSFDSNSDSTKPEAYWRFIFAKTYIAVNKRSDELVVDDFKLAGNMFLLPDALSNNSGLDFDLSIAIAQLIFKQIKPDAEEFIPKMPQPPVSEELSADGIDIEPVMPPQDEEATANNIVEETASFPQADPAVLHDNLNDSDSQMH